MCVYLALLWEYYMIYVHVLSMVVRVCTGVCVLSNIVWILQDVCVYLVLLCGY